MAMSETLKRVKPKKHFLLESCDPDDEGELTAWARKGIEDARHKPDSAYIRYR